MLHRTFVAWDYLVFGLMVAASIGIGIFYALRYRKQRNTDEYLFAARSMTCFPVAISLLASFESSIMMLGTPAEAYAYGIQWILNEIGYVLGSLLEIMLLVAFLKKLNLLSPFQYLEGRFRSRVLRRVVTAVRSVDILLYMSVVLYGQGIALQTVTGFSMVGSILVTGAAAVVYTTLGGLRAVIWTDVLQFTFMIIGILALSIKGTIDAGGIDEVWSRAKAGGRFEFDVDPDPTVRHTVWNLLFGRFWTGFGFIFNPAVLQRISSTKSVAQAQRCMLGTVIGFPLIVGIALIEGIVAYGYYDYKRCDPVESKQVDSVNQIVPYMILDVFRYQPGLPGLFLASLFSASLSTLSSGFSAFANIMLEDFVRPCLPGLTEVKAWIFARCTVFLCGLLSCILAFLISAVGGTTLNQIVYSLQAITAGPVTGLFYLGLLFPLVDTKSAVAAVLTGVSFLSWLMIGSNVSRGVRQSSPLPSAPTDECLVFNVTLRNNITMLSTTQTPSSYSGSGLDAFYSVSYTLYNCFGILLVLVVGLILSLLTGGNKGNVDYDYVLPVLEKLSWCLPRSIIKYCYIERKDRGKEDEMIHMAEVKDLGDETARC